MTNFLLDMDHLVNKPIKCQNTSSVRLGSRSPFSGGDALNTEPGRTIDRDNLGASALGCCRIPQPREHRYVCYNQSARIDCLQRNLHVHSLQFILVT